MALSRLGLQKTTLLDYPGKVAATLFTQGCNLRCPYCHNKELISGSPPEDFWDRADIEAFLKKRAPVLGGVCITGGEPTLHRDLPELIDFIHSLGLLVKIDTNGLEPVLLMNLEADYIAMDLKTSLERYDRMGCSLPTEEAEDRLQSSLDYIAGSGIPHQFRTTIVPGLVSERDIRRLLGRIPGGSPLVLQRFRPGETLDPAYAECEAPAEEEMERLRAIVAACGPSQGAVS